MQFTAGSGVSQEEVNGISSMFLTFFDPDGFKIIERTEVDRVIAEQNFQKGSLTEKEMAKLGSILNLQYLVLGDINLVQNQYNVDARVIDVETARIIATSGMTFSGVSYRDNMQKIAQELAKKLSSTVSRAPTVNNTRNQHLEVSILYGYLKVFPNDLGYFEQPPSTVISRINESAQYGYNTWRIPTSEEVALMRAAALLGNDTYMSAGSTKGGMIRLVTDQGTAEEVNAERQAAAERERIEREQRERLEEQRRIEEQKRLEAQRELRRRQEAEERAFQASLSPWEKAYYAGLKHGYVLKVFEHLDPGETYVTRSGDVIYNGFVWGEAVMNNLDFDVRGYDFYLELSKIPDINAYLMTRKEWYCAEKDESYDKPPITCSWDSKYQTYSYAIEETYISATKSKGYKNVLTFDDPEGRFYDSRRYEGKNAYGRSVAAGTPLILGKRVSPAVASSIISDFKTKRKAQIEKEKKDREAEERKNLFTKLEEQQRLEEQRRLEEEHRSEEALQDNSDEMEIKKTAEITSVNVDWNEVRNGVKGMLIHVNFRVAGYKDEVFFCVAYFHYADGTPIKDTNDSFRSTTGAVCAGRDFTSRYDNTICDDFRIWIPNDEIHVDTSNGPVKCYFEIKFYLKEAGEFLNVSQKVPFTIGV